MDLFSGVGSWFSGLFTKKKKRQDEVATTPVARPKPVVTRQVERQNTQIASQPKNDRNIRQFNPISSEKTTSNSAFNSNLYKPSQNASKAKQPLTNQLSTPKLTPTQQITNSLAITKPILSYKTDKTSSTPFVTIRPHIKHKTLSMKKEYLERAKEYKPIQGEGGEKSFLDTTLHEPIDHRSLPKPYRPTRKVDSIQLSIKPEQVKPKPSVQSQDRNTYNKNRRSGMGVIEANELQAKRDLDRKLITQAADAKRRAEATAKKAPIIDSINATIETAKQNDLGGNSQEIIKRGEDLKKRLNYVNDLDNTNYQDMFNRQAENYGKVIERVTSANELAAKVYEKTGDALKANQVRDKQLKTSSELSALENKLVNEQDQMKAIALATQIPRNALKAGAMYLPNMVTGITEFAGNATGFDELAKGSRTVREAIEKPVSSALDNQYDNQAVAGVVQGVTDLGLDILTGKAIAGLGASNKIASGATKIADKLADTNRLGQLTGKVLTGMAGTAEKVGTTGVSVLRHYPNSYNEIYNDAMANGVDHNTASKLAHTNAIGNALVEKLSLDQAKWLQGGGTVQKAVLSASRTLGEGVEEFTQSIISSAVKDVYSDVDWDEELKTAGYAGVMGLGVGFLGDAIFTKLPQLQQSIQNRVDARIDPNKNPILNATIASATFDRAQQAIAELKDESAKFMLAGQNATGYADAQANGLVFDGVDGKPRFEIDDSGAKIKNQNGKTLGEMLDHPELFKNYPELESMLVDHNDDLEFGAGGNYSPATNYGPATINMRGNAKEFVKAKEALNAYHRYSTNPSLVEKKAKEVGLTPDEVLGSYRRQAERAERSLQSLQNRTSDKQKSTLLHETQHAIQDIENTARGASLRGTKNMSEYFNSAGEAEARAVQARMDMPMSERYETPDKVYHGSRSADIDQFNLDNLNQTYMKDGLGVNFTTDKSFAELYRRPKNQWGELSRTDDGGGKVYERYVNAKNPLDLTKQSRKVSDVVDFNTFSKIAKDGSELDTQGREYLERFARGELTTKDTDSRIVAQQVQNMSNDELLKIVYGRIANLEMTGLDAGLERIFRELAFNFKLTNEGSKKLVESFRKNTGFDAVKVPKEDGNYVVTSFNPENISETAKPRSTFYDSLDVNKDDLIIKDPDSKLLLSNNQLDSRRQRVKDAEHAIGMHEIMLEQLEPLLIQRKAEYKAVPDRAKLKNIENIRKEIVDRKREMVRLDKVRADALHEIQDSNRDVNKEVRTIVGDKINIINYITDNAGAPKDARGYALLRDKVMAVLDGKLSTGLHEASHIAYGAMRIVSPDQANKTINRIINHYKPQGLVDMFKNSGYAEVLGHEPDANNLADVKYLAEEKLGNDFVEYYQAKQKGRENYYAKKQGLGAKIVQLFEKAIDYLVEAVKRFDSAYRFMSDLEAGKMVGTINKAAEAIDSGLINDKIDQESMMLLEDEKAAQPTPQFDELDVALMYYVEEPKEALDLDLLRAEYKGNRDALARIDKADAEHKKRFKNFDQNVKEAQTMLATLKQEALKHETLRAFIEANRDVVEGEYDSIQLPDKTRTSAYTLYSDAYRESGLPLPKPEQDERLKQQKETERAISEFREKTRVKFPTNIKGTQLQKLKLESLKHDSPDSFIESFGLVVHRGGPKNMGLSESIDLDYGGGYYFAEGTETAASYGQETNEYIVRLENPLHIKNRYAMNTIVDNYLDEQEDGETDAESTKEYLQSKGYDGIISEDGGLGGEKNVGRYIIAYDPSKIATRQQLTDIYNQAHAQTTPQPSTPKFPGLVDDLMQANSTADVMAIYEKYGIPVDQGTADVTYRYKDNKNQLDVMTADMQTADEIRKASLAGTYTVKEQGDYLLSRDNFQRDIDGKNLPKYSGIESEFTVEVPKNGSDLVLVKNDKGTIFSETLNSAQSKYGTTDPKLLANRIINGKKAEATPSTPTPQVEVPVQKLGDTEKPTTKIIGDTSAIKKGNIRPDKITTLSGQEINLPQYNPNSKRNPQVSKQINESNRVLVEAAINEAKIRNDSFNLGQFEDMARDVKNLSDSDLSGINLYLFDNPDGVKLTYDNSPKVKVEKSAEPNPFVQFAPKPEQAPTPQVEAPTTQPEVPAILTDANGIEYTQSQVPVASLKRDPKYQPRTTASGKGTENSVFEKGYNEGMVDQPMLVRKVGDEYQVLGGHSRTLGMERRAKAGLTNPELVNARVYENITDDQARIISRAANQGGQYESTLDMAKSISDSINEGLTPSVQKQNMTKGFSYDDYKYLWEVAQTNNILRSKMAEGGISSDDALHIARHGRVKGLSADKTMAIIKGLDNNGTFNKQNAKNVINMLTGKIEAGVARDDQSGLFGDMAEVINAVDTLSDFTKKRATLVKQQNAIKEVTRLMPENTEAIKAMQVEENRIAQELEQIGVELRQRTDKSYKPVAKPVVEPTPKVEAVLETPTPVVEPTSEPVAPIEFVKPKAKAKTKAKKLADMKIPTVDEIQASLREKQAKEDINVYKNLADARDLPRRGKGKKGSADRQAYETFREVTKEYLANRDSAKFERQGVIASLRRQYKLTPEEALNALKRIDDPKVEALTPKVDEFAKEFKRLTDIAYQNYTGKGIEMGYVHSYLPRNYKSPVDGQPVDRAEYELLITGSARTKNRTSAELEADALISLDPVELLERYYSSMDKAFAGRQYLKQLELNGLVVKASEPVRGLQPITAQGLQPSDGMVYYGKPGVVNNLNTMFSDNSPRGVVAMGLAKLADLNSLAQTFVLSGGAPNTPLNSFGIMQVTKEFMGGNVKNPMNALSVGFSKKRAKAYFTNKQNIIKLMAENGVAPSINLAKLEMTGRERIKQAELTDGRLAGIGQAWDEMTNDATFKRFMPALEVGAFEKVYDKLLKKTGDSKQSAAVAAEVVRNFYGKTDNFKLETRDQLTNDAAGAFLFAPRFRESMINFWIKNAKTLNPKGGFANLRSQEYRMNAKFIMMAALTYGLQDMLNELLNGAHLHENPDGKQDKLIIPVAKLKEWGIETNGKDIAIPFLSSISTVPRNIAMGLVNFAKGNNTEGMKNVTQFGSMPLKTAGELLTNQDYFGREIFDPEATLGERAVQTGAYVFRNYNHPWVRGAMDKAGQSLDPKLKKALGVKDKSNTELIANALESPLRFYDPKYYNFDGTFVPTAPKGEKWDFKEQREKANLKADVKNITKRLGLSKSQAEKFEAITSADFDEEGNIVDSGNKWSKYERYNMLHDNGVFRAYQDKAMLDNKITGKPIDPLLSLQGDQRHQVLFKKSLPPGTSDPTVKQLYEQDWYDEYRAKEDKYYTEKQAWNDKMGYKSAPNDNPYPTNPPEVQQAMDYYYSYPARSKERTAFRKSNPDLWSQMVAQWEAQDAWKNGERALLGLGSLDEYATTSTGSSSGTGASGRTSTKSASKETKPPIYQVLTEDLISGLTKAKANGTFTPLTSYKVARATARTPQIKRLNGGRTVSAKSVRRV